MIGGVAIAGWALPRSLDVEILRPLSLVVVAGSVIAAFVAARIVSKLAVKVVAIGLLALTALGAWLIRDDLSECRQTCACDVGGIEIAANEVPGCP